MVDSRKELVELVAGGGVAGNDEDGIIAGNGTKDQFRTTIVDVIRHGIGKTRACLHHSELTAKVHTVDRHLRQIGINTQHFLFYNRIDGDDVFERTVWQDFLLGTQVV